MKQFIRNVRASKTIADERSVVQKESAAIRASFREERHDHNIRCELIPPSIDILEAQKLVQEEQCCETSLSFHLRRTDTLWANRMFEASGFSAFRGQATRISRDNALTRREPGGLDLSNKLPAEVRPLFVVLFVVD